MAREYMIRYYLAQENVGIEINDLRLKRISFLEGEVPTIYTRMRAQRDQIATQFRNDGEKKAASLRAETDHEEAIILAEAQNKADAITAEGELSAIDIFIQALAQVPELSRYQQILEAYKISGIK